MHGVRRTLTLLPSALLLAVLATAGGACGQARAGRLLAVGPLARLPASSSAHVAIIVMENKELPEVLGNPAAPYVNALARRYGLATTRSRIRRCPTISR
jgi:hypothetical protein